MDAQEKSKSVNQGFGPIPKSRGKRSTIAAAVAMLLYLIILVVHRYLKQGVHPRHLVQLSDVVFWCGLLSSAIFGEIARRFCLFIEEYQHKDTRYKGSRCKALEACLWSKRKNQTALIMFSISSAIVVYNWISKQSSPYPLPMYVAFAVIGSIGTHLLDMKSPTKVEISELNESENKHVSDGLAWSYYFGYLKLIFPEWQVMIGKAQGESFQIDGQDVRDKLDDNRLFIIIPKDGYCYDKFTKIDPNIEFITTMPEQKILRGGVQERIYKNSLYRVQKEGKEPMYVMMEYAIPLLSMYDMSKELSAAFDTQNLEEQVVEFYKKLEQILAKDPKMKNNFCIVLTAGSKTNEESNKNVPLADIMWDSVRKVEVPV